MKTDVISIDNREHGFSEALSQTLKAAAFRDLDNKQTLQLRLCTEEMLSLARSVTGELAATFWLESEGKDFELHLSTKTVMDAEKRKLLIDSATSRKNEAANSFLEWDKYEQSILGRVADDVKIAIRGGVVDMTVSKSFA